jgi:DNA-binding MarR family transcriptional regulator
MAQTPDLTVSELAEIMNVTSQFVTIETGKLIGKGIVEKRPNASDRRSSFLNLTPKGRNLVRELAPLQRRANNLHFRSLTENQARALTEMLRAIKEDGKRVIHELESPDIVNAMAPSARLQADPPDDMPRSDRKKVRRR